MKLATALVPLIVLLGSAACHAAVTYPFIETDREDPDWVVASSRLILTDGRSIPDWYDDPEDPAFPWLVHFWKFEGDKQDGRAVPMQSTFGGGLNGIYVREGFDLYLYDDGNTDQPYLGNDACGFEHAAILEGPYFASPCDLLHNPSNPDPNNFAARTFFSSKSIGALGRDGLIVAPRRVIILDIDGLRRDAFYSMISRWTGRIPNLASVILGKRANGGDFNGLVRTNALWTGKDDMQADGDTDFSRSFQSVGVNYAVTVLPSYTFACQATLFTGVAPAAHGILGNEWFNRFAGNFNDAHNFRRGYSGGSARSVNQITRNYEWSFIGGKEQESACTATLVALAAGDFGWGGLCSTDLQFPTVYQQLSDDYDLSSVIGFNMYLEDTNYHADPNIHWARPSDDDLCTYNEDDTGKLYDRSMINTTLAYLRRLRQQEEPFPDVVTVYFAGHDHNMHMLGNNQTAYLQSTVDPEFGRFLKGISPWVDPRNFLYAISTDHGHTQLKHDSEHSIIVEDELEEVLWDMTPRYDCFDNIFEEEFTAYVALNGGMAHVHLRRQGSNLWSQAPSTANLLAVADAMYHFESAAGGEKIEFIMGKDLDSGNWFAPYQAYDPVSKSFVDLGGYLAAHPELDYVDFVRRVGEMNRGRAGDLVMVPKVMAGYYFDVKQVSGHGSPYGTDSYIPMVFAGRGLQRIANADRNIANGDQTDFATTVAGLLGTAIQSDGVDRVGPLLD